MLFFEDLITGSSQTFGNYDVTREEAMQFAETYDPQPFHLDDEAAEQTHFGRLSASGWHTCAMTMRMLVDNMKVDKQASLGSPGIDHLRWMKPVYPGDTLTCRTEVLEKRRSQSRPEMGIFKSKIQTFNQDGDMVLEMVTNGLIQVRDPSAPMD